MLLLNLLKNNSSNQNFFKEGSYVQRMKPWFEVGDDNAGWSAQKVTNLHYMLQVRKAVWRHKGGLWCQSTGVGLYQCIL